jgi:hypothetical protein
MGARISGAKLLTKKTKPKPKGKPRRKVAIHRTTPAEAGWDAEVRDDHYAQACRAAVKHGETDKLVRHLMAAGLAAASTADASSVLADDLTLLRWVLRKMTDNRRDMELRQIAGEML